MCVALGFIGLLSACGSEGASAILPPEKTFWDLAINHRAVTLCTCDGYNTIQLVATPRNPMGAPLEELPTAVFSARDSSVVVTPTGEVRARYPASMVKVVARLTVGNVTQSDTTFINITSALPPTMPNRLDMSVAPDDSTRLAYGIEFFFGLVIPVHPNPARALDVDGVDVPDIAVYYHSGDVSSTTIDKLTGVVQGRTPGSRSYVYATAMAYGIPLRDSIEYVITNPLITMVEIARRVPAGQTTPIAIVSPATIEVGVGALVGWANNSGIPVEVVFDQPSAAELADFPFLPPLHDPPRGGMAGNIPMFLADTIDGEISVGARVRTFRTPGTHKYTIPQFGTRGTIVVR